MLLSSSLVKPSTSKSSFLVLIISSSIFTFHVSCCGSGWHWRYIQSLKHSCFTLVFLVCNSILLRLLPVFALTSSLMCSRNCIGSCFLEFSCYEPNMIFCLLNTSNYFSWKTENHYITIWWPCAIYLCQANRQKILFWTSLTQNYTNGFSLKRKHLSNFMIDMSLPSFFFLLPMLGLLVQYNII